MCVGVCVCVCVGVCVCVCVCVCVRVYLLFVLFCKRALRCISSDRFKFGHLLLQIHPRMDDWTVIAAEVSLWLRSCSSSCLTTSLKINRKSTLGENIKEIQSITVNHRHWPFLTVKCSQSYYRELVMELHQFLCSLALTVNKMQKVLKGLGKLTSWNISAFSST